MTRNRLLVAAALITFGLLGPPAPVTAAPVTAAAVTPPTVTAAPGPSGPTAPEGVGTADWRTVSVGDGHACGIRTTGRLYCWGGDTEGGLGDGASTEPHLSPVEVFGGHTDWTAVSVGGFHTCGRRSNGRLYCWGRDDEGAVGNGEPLTDRVVPTPVAGDRTDWVSVAAGSRHTCGLVRSGRLFCWGIDEFGALGSDGTDMLSATPIEVFGARTDWAQVTTGSDFTCGLRTTGRLFCWGRGSNGELGDDGVRDTKVRPVQVFGARTDWAQVSAGGSHTCARRTTGVLFCWGWDFYGQVGDGGTNLDRSTPRQVATFFSDWTMVRAGGSHTCARRATGAVQCWGRDAFGQVGDGEPFADRTTPTFLDIDGPLSMVETGGSSSCGRSTTGYLLCWGNDGNGLLGDGEPQASQGSPVDVDP